MDNLATSIEQVKNILEAIKGMCQQAADLLVEPTTPPDTTTPPPAPEAEKIVINAQNYKQKLVNIDKVDFSGTTTEFVRINKNHNMLAIPCTYENLDFEVDAMVVSGTTEDRLLQWQTRGGRHSDNAMCEGCAYKASFESFFATIRKELFHRSSNLTGGNGYCKDRTSSIKYAPIKGVRHKYKLSVRNIAGNNVLIQAFIDGNKVAETVDKGDWFWEGTNQPVCPAREFGNTGNRKKNEKLNKAGSWVIMRSDGDTVWQFWQAVVTKR